MRAFVTVLIAVFAATSSSVLAQWPSWPTPDVPKTADGRPNLDAPAPRTADGKVDFSGIWDSRLFLVGFGGIPGGNELGRGEGGGRGSGAAAQPTDRPPLATFFDIGANIKGGAPMQPWAAALKKQRMVDNLQDNPLSHCLPIGHTQLWLHPQPRKIVQTPRELLMILGNQLRSAPRLHRRSPGSR